jgi:hypothetical protein
MLDGSRRKVNPTLLDGWENLFPVFSKEKRLGYMHAGTLLMTHLIGWYLHVIGETEF